MSLPKVNSKIEKYLCYICESMGCGLRGATVAENVSHAEGEAPTK